jgi:gliding motility-associated-like protein
MAFYSPNLSTPMHIFSHPVQTKASFLFKKENKNVIFKILFFNILYLNIAYAQVNIDNRVAANFTFRTCKGTDDSGNGSSIAFIGSPKCVCGVRDSAFRFEKEQEGLVFVGPLSEVFTTGDFSISFYIKPVVPKSGQGATQVILSKQAQCNRRSGFWVRFQPGSNIISSTITQNDTLNVTVSGRLDPNACWNHIVLIRTNSRYSLYINGTQRDVKNSRVRLDLTSGAALKLGEPVCPLDRTFSGEIDEIRLYNKTLNEDEIKVLYVRPDNILTGDTLIYLGNSFRVNTSPTCASSFSWTPSRSVSDPTAPNTVITPSEPTTYFIKFQYGECTATDSINVKVIDPDTLDCTKVFIPNAFTPGSTIGRNDRFAISNPFVVQQFISFEVFDRWGSRVFNAQNAFDSWDGTFQGLALNPGVFLFRLRYQCNGVEEVKSGSLLLMK